MALLNCGHNCNILGSESSERQKVQAAARVDESNRAACTNDTEANEFFICLGIKFGLFCRPIFNIDVTTGCEATCEKCKLHCIFVHLLHGIREQRLATMGDRPNDKYSGCC
jgi:hypothetical protein